MDNINFLYKSNNVSTVASFIDMHGTVGVLTSNKGY